MSPALKWSSDNRYTWGRVWRPLLRLTRRSHLRRTHAVRRVSGDVHKRALCNRARVVPESVFVLSSARGDHHAHLIPARFPGSTRTWERAIIERAPPGVPACAFLRSLHGTAGFRLCLSSLLCLLPAAVSALLSAFGSVSVLVSATSLPFALASALNSILH